MTRRSGFTVLVIVNVVCWCVLSFYQKTTAAPPSGNQPFANSVEQRQESVAQLKEINAQLKELNALLNSGKLGVVIRDVERR